MKSNLPVDNCTLWIGAEDKEMTDQSYIYPGLGDAGDLAFGKKYKIRRIIMKHLFFDLDRTLWDFESNSHETLIEICTKHKLDDKGVNDFDSFIKCIKIIMRSYGISIEKIKFLKRI